MVLKLLWICSIFVLISGFHGYNSDLPGAEIPVGKILSIAKKKCMKNSNDEKSVSQLQIALMELDVCFAEYEFPELGDADINFSLFLEDVCVNLRNYGYGCVRDFANQIQPCLDAEEKYLPEFMLTAYNNTFNVMCENKQIGSFLKSKLGNQSTACDNLLDHAQNDIFGACLLELKLIQDLYNSDYLIIRKNDLCSDIKRASTCAVEKIRKYCRNDSDYDEAVDIISSIYFNQCEDVLINET